MKKKKPIVMHGRKIPKDTEFRSDRLLTDKEVKNWDVQLPPDWGRTPDMLGPAWPVRRGKPAASGMGYVMSPYQQWYTRIYGVTPIADLPKYRKMYRNEPDIRQAIDLQALLAAGKGFTVEHNNNDVEKFLNDLLERTYVHEALFVAVKDALVYGSSFVEILWAEGTTEEETVEIPPDIVADILRNQHPGMLEFKAMQADKKIIQQGEKWYVNAKVFKNKNAAEYIEANNKNGKGDSGGKPIEKSVYPNIAGLKPLDPLYMRVRRDAFGNVYGYIQWLNFPPVIIKPEDLLHFKYSATSEGYASAYGQSLLLPLIKNNDLLNQFENDMAVWMHNQVVLPTIFKGGSAEKPYTRDMMVDLMSKFANRTNVSNIFVRGDVEVTPLQGAAKNLKVDWWLQYLQRRRWVALGVPPVALGIQEPGGRMIGEVMFQEFITRIQKIQTQFGNIMIEQLFVPLIAAKFGDKILKKDGKPTVVFKPIVEEDRNLRQARLIQAANSGVISVNEARIGMGYTTLRESKYDIPIALVIEQAKEQMKMQEKLSETQTEQQMELMDKQVEHTRKLAPYEQQRSEMDLEKQKLGLEKQKLVNQSPTGGKHQPGGQPPQKMSLDMRPDSGRTKQPIIQPKKTINKKTVAIKSEQDIRDEVINVYNIVAFNLKHPGPMLVKDIRVDAQERIERVIDEYSSEIGEPMKRIFMDEFMGTVNDLIRNKEELQAL